MRYGASAHTHGDIEKRSVQGGDFAEIAIPNVASLRRWWESGVKNTCPNVFFLIAHGPIMENPADLGHGRVHYLPSLFASVEAAFRIGVRYLTMIIMNLLWADLRGECRALFSVSAQLPGQRGATTAAPLRLRTYLAPFRQAPFPSLLGY